MITPVFEITQDDFFIYLVINAPYSKVSEADVYVEGEDFKFHAKPYFLRLKLPGSVIEDDRACCHYDADNGKYRLKIAKEKSGEFFEDLDMLTKLLAPSGGREMKQPLIEVLDGSLPELEEVVEFDWCFPQSCGTEIQLGNAMGGGYGFGGQKSGIFGKLQADLQGAVQVKNLEGTSPQSRLNEKLDYENGKFDPDHYLADFFEDEEIDRLVKMRPPWRDFSGNLQFTDDEKYVLKNLPNREYLLNKPELQAVYLSLVDILFGYAYNWRQTEGENSTESAWNIRTVSATLSWCTCCNSMQETMIAAYRRTLIFPFYRSWKLAKACHRDVTRILLQGKKYILKCFIEIYDIFAKSELYYIINDLYIKDYCIWIQKSSSAAIKSLAESLKECKLGKSDVQLGLLELEDVAQCVLEGPGVESDRGAEDTANAFSCLKL